MEIGLFYIFAGTILFCLSTGISGTFNYLRRQSLLGDVISHSVLPGLAIAFLLAQTKNLFVLLPGAVISSWFSVSFVEWLRKKSKIDSQSALAISLSLFFAFGIVLLTYAQQNSLGNQSGITSYIFGSAASITQEDFFLSIFVFIIMLLFTSIFYKQIRLYCFDENFAKASLKHQKLYPFLLRFLTVLSVAAGVHVMGVILITGLLVVPVSIGRMWSNRLSIVLIIGAGSSMISGFLGAYVSYLYEGVPTGPWIIISSMIFVVFSIIFAPRTGVVFSQFRKTNQKLKTAKENVLKVIYQYSKENKGLSRVKLKENYPRPGELSWVLILLKIQSYIKITDNKIILLDKGLLWAKKVVRRHRLWETYIHQYLKLPLDHVHDDAEGLEHLIDDKMEKELYKLLGEPSKDPHQSEIPQ